MLLTITICLTGLVFINLILLKFSCSKTNNPLKQTKKPIVFKPSTTELVPNRLAPTGS